MANVLSAHHHKPFHHISSTVVPHLTPIYTFKISLSLNLGDATTLHCPVFALQLLTHTISGAQGCHSPLSPGSFPCCVWQPPVCEPELWRCNLREVSGSSSGDSFQRISQAMPSIGLFGSKWHLPGGLLSSTASHTLIFRMKARSNCSTWDSRDSELWRRQKLLLACSKGLKLLPEYLPGLGFGCHGQAGMETSPNGKKRWLGDLKDKSLHGVVLFIQDYNHNFLHIILQEPRQKNPFLNTSCLLPTVCFTYLDAVGVHSVVGPDSTSPYPKPEFRLFLAIRKMLLQSHFFLGIKLPACG